MPHTKSAFALISDLRLDAVHLFGNALLIAGAVAWLLIPEARVSQLLLSALSALVIVFLFAWLHCGTLAHALTPERQRLTSDFRRALRRLPLFLVLAVVLAFLMRWIYTEVMEKSWQISGYVFANLPKSVLGTSGVDKVASVLDVVTVSLVWVVLPALFVPFLATVAAGGVNPRGLVAALRLLAKWRYWLAVVVIGFVGVWLPRILVDWTPGRGLRQETVSLVVRFTIAYLLAVLAWLAAASVVGRFLREAEPVQRTVGEPVA